MFTFFNSSDSCLTFWQQVYIVLCIYVFTRLVRPFGLNYYWWYSRDFNKIQTTTLLILLKFYFHDLQEQLKTTFHTNFRSEWVLRFVMDPADAWISKLFRDVAFTYGRKSCNVGLNSDLFRGIWLSELFVYFKKVLM